MKLFLVTHDSMILQEFLNNEGHRVIFSASELDALARIKQEQFDLILLDLDLKNSKEDKIDLLIAFKQAQSEIQVVTLTDSNSFDLEKAAREHGVISYLTKPVNLADLEIIVKHLEERSHVHRDNH